VDISMPGYIKKKIQEYGHIIHKLAQTCLYSSEPKQLGTEAQAPLPPNASTKLDIKGIKHIHHIIGSILHYAWAVNMTVLTALNSIAVDQTKATLKMLAQCTQLLYYFSYNADVKILFYASDMILNIHSYTVYLLEPKA
jgi:hypothetical protein